jgi:hypothetical protein
MESGVVFKKTAAGQQEITARTHKALAKLRPVLIMVDGKASVADLMTTAGKFCDAADALRQLLDAGLIEPASPLRSAPVVESTAAADAVPSAEKLRTIVRALNDALV